MIYTPAGIAILLTLILYSLLAFVLKDGKKAGLVVSLFLLLFFSYGHIFNLIYTAFGQVKSRLLAGILVTDPNRLLSIWGIILIFGAYFIIRTQKKLDGLTSILNLVALFLVATSVFNIGRHEFKRRSVFQDMRLLTKASAREADGLGMGKAAQANMPDIYYIIFDRHASSTTLKEYFDYDNGEFENYLKEKGFFIASKSQANYPATHLSLASSLNMEYLDYLKDIVGEESEDLTVLREMLQDYKVWRFLKSKGYKFIHIGSWWLQTGTNKFADINLGYDHFLKLNEFYYKFFKTTALLPVIKANSELDNLRKGVEHQFEQIAEIPQLKGPKFVFAHMLIPHDPYVFGPNGEPLTEQEVKNRSEKENYLNQLIYTNKKIRWLVDKLILRSKQPPVIVLQSDEGPRLLIQREWEELSDKGLDYERLSQDAIRMHMRIFNAYYLPGFNKKLLYESISPVNTFRLIFNFYFGTNYELLKDESYNVVDWLHPYKFVNITEKL